MTEWIAWTKCSICRYAAKDVLQKSSEAEQLGLPLDVNCPQCGSPARLITFPAFEIETIDTSLPSRFSYETMEDW